MPINIFITVFINLKYFINGERNNFEKTIPFNVHKNVFINTALNLMSRLRHVNPVHFKYMYIF